MTSASTEPEFSGPLGEKDQRILVIKAQSAGYKGGDFALISINGNPVKVQENENGSFRGLHIAVINPSNGKVQSAQAFDTYKSSEALEKFISETEIPNNFIVAAACKDDCSLELTFKVKSWFSGFGATKIWEVQYRQGYAFIGVSGKSNSANEKKSKKRKERVAVTQVFYVNSDPKDIDEA